MSCRLAPSTTTAIGMPCASVNKLRLTPPLPRSVGLGPVFFPSQRGLRHRAVHRQPRPINLVDCIKRQQPQAPELLEYPGLSPLLEQPMRRTTRANTGGTQGIPLTARAQYKQDRVHRRTVTHPGLCPASGCGLRGGKSGSICSQISSGNRQPLSFLSKPMIDLLITNLDLKITDETYWNTLLVHLFSSFVGITDLMQLEKDVGRSS